VSRAQFLVHDSAPPPGRYGGSPTSCARCSSSATRVPTSFTGARCRFDRAECSAGAVSSRRTICNAIAPSGAHPSADLSGTHDLLDAAAQLRWGHDGRDPQHPRGLRHAPRFGTAATCTSSPKRCVAPSSTATAGSAIRFRRHAARPPAVEVVRATLGHRSIPKHATPTPPQAGGGSGEPMHTTHYSIVDSQGNAAAVTTTLNGGFGSGVTVTGPDS